MSRSTIWTAAEDEQLRAQIEIKGTKWTQIALEMRNKTPNQIASRWKKCLNPKLVKGPFAPEEDLMVTNWVANNGTQSWNLLEKQIINRSAKQ
jgi:hypothetical protein